MTDTMPAPQDEDSVDYREKLGHECDCGCGQPAYVGVETSARRLGACKQSAVGLMRLSNAGGRLGASADHLLWSWSRAEPALDALVHGRENESVLGVPTAMWTSVWRERAADLQVKATKHHSAGRRNNKALAGSRM